MPELSSFSSLTVIIPTYNRRSVLAKALEAYRGQSCPELISELLVVDDGSTDGTDSLVRGFSSTVPFPVRYLWQGNKGPAAARNLGIREARSELLLFTDSDIIPEHGLVEQHLDWHNRNSEISAAVLGYVTWSPEVKATPFMHWYGENALFAYRLLRGKREADFRFFYTCNLSVKREFLQTCGYFDEDFKSAAYEDSELGYRLNKKGLQILYNCRAIAYHHQFFTFEEACRKAADNTAAKRLFEQKEAGQHWQAEHRKISATLRFQVTTQIQMVMATFLGLSKCLPDLRMPLPSLVYRCLYWRQLTRAAAKEE